MIIDKTNTERAAVEGKRIANIGGYIVHKNLFEALKTNIGSQVKIDGITYSPQTIEDIIIALKRPSERQAEINNFEVFVENFEKITIEDIDISIEKKRQELFDWIERFFPVSIGLPDMIGTNYFQGFSKEQVTERKNKIIDLHNRLTTANRLLEKQDEDIDGGYRGMDGTNDL